MTSCKPPPTCIDASPIPDANDSRMSAIPYEANLTPMGLSPPGCWTCPAHRTLRAGAWRRGRFRPPGQHLRAALCCKAGWGNERVKRRDLCSLRRGGRTIVGIEQHPPSEKDAGHPEQSVTDAPQGTAIGVPTRPQRLIAAAASAVVQHGYPRPVKHSVSQSDLGGMRMTTMQLLPLRLVTGATPERVLRAA